jgi:small multidrug resistance family-3 protein
VTAARSGAIFAIAAAFELGGTYAVWRWLREGATPLLGALGAALLVGYSAVQSRQPTAGYGRAYAAYAGIFLVGALAWGWLVDRKTPDRFDLIGGAVVLAGVLVILLGRRLG